MTHPIHNSSFWGQFLQAHCRTSSVRALKDKMVFWDIKEGYHKMSATATITGRTDMSNSWMIGLTALSAQIGYIVHLVSILQLKKWNLWVSWQCDLHTINHYNKTLQSGLCRGNPKHEKCHELQANHLANVLTNETKRYRKIHNSINLNN